MKRRRDENSCSNARNPPNKRYKASASRKTKRSDVWVFFGERELKGDTWVSKCLICGEFIAESKSKTTSQFRGHIRNKHPQVISFGIKEGKQTVENATKFFFKRNVKDESYTREANFLFDKFIVSSSSPMDICENSDFRKLMNHVSFGQYNPYSTGNTTKNHIMDQYVQIKGSLQDAKDFSGSVCASFDEWTDNYHKRHFTGVTFSYVFEGENTLEFKTRGAGLIELEESNAVGIGESITNLLSFWDIDSKKDVSLYVVDGASVCGAAVRNELRSENLWGLCHFLDLQIKNSLHKSMIFVKSGQRFIYNSSTKLVIDTDEASSAWIEYKSFGKNAKLKDKYDEKSWVFVPKGKTSSFISVESSTITRLQKTVLKFKSSTIYSKELKKAQDIQKKVKDLENHNLPMIVLDDTVNKDNLKLESLKLYVKTRCFTLANMIRSVIANESCIKSVQNKYPDVKINYLKDNSNPDQSDWKFAKEMYQSLKVIDQTIKFLETSTRSIIGRTITAVKGLLTVLKNLLSEMKNDDSKRFLFCYITNVETLFGENYPGFKYLVISAYFDPTGNRTNLLSNYRSILSPVREKYTQLFQLNQQTLEKETDENANTRSTTDIFSTHEKFVDSRRMNNWINFMNEAQTSMTIDCLSWWNNKRKTYPIIWKIAKQYLGMVPSSAITERTFKVTTNIQTFNRSNMSVVTLEALHFLKVNKDLMKVEYTPIPPKEN